MTPETSRLIAETLRLDAAVVSTHAKLEILETHSPAWWKVHEDWCEIRDERDGYAIRSAPRLARMLEVAVNALICAEANCGHVRDDVGTALAEIERIAKE